jgi:mRNA-degrading endonuclease RelE of RelBE toxin-antitoxin system
MYKIQGVSKKTNKRLIERLSRFSDEEVAAIKNELANKPKGNPASHWKIKKVAPNVWQYDLPQGFRLEYTVDDALEVVFILFTGSHNEAAAYLRSKK